MNEDYGDVKRQSMAGDHYLVNLDLVRRFASMRKNTINENNDLIGNSSIVYIAGT